MVLVSAPFCGPKRAGASSNGVRTSQSTTSAVPCRPPASSIAAIAPAPPSVVALPPAATRTTAAPAAAAATISSPVPRVDAAMGSRSSSATRCSPDASATSTIAVPPSSISAKPAAAIGRPSGSVAGAPAVSPPSAVSRISNVPSPPSATGQRSGGTSPARSRPAPMHDGHARGAQRPLERVGRDEHGRMRGRQGRHGRRVRIDGIEARAVLAEADAQSRSPQPSPRSAGTILRKV